METSLPSAELSLDAVTACLPSDLSLSDHPAVALTISRRKEACLPVKRVFKDERK